MFSGMPDNLIAKRTHENLVETEKLSVEIMSFDVCQFAIDTLFTLVIFPVSMKFS